MAMRCGLLRSLDDVTLPVGRAAFRSRTTISRRVLIDRVQRHLRRHEGERIHLAELGRALGASPAYLAELFREVVGIPLYRYQLQMRLTRARELLGTQDDLARLALDLGFSSHSHFTTAFRRRYGDTPAQARARIRRSSSTE
jgi:AraC-like DNA-binding protein